jgi:hypothetical protein
MVGTIITFVFVMNDEQKYIGVSIPHNTIDYKLAWYSNRKLKLYIDTGWVFNMKLPKISGKYKIINIVNNLTDYELIEMTNIMTRKDDLVKHLLMYEFAPTENYLLIKII